WPKAGTKRWNALDAAREEGSEAAMDAAVSSSSWLARDPSASTSDLFGAAGAFDAPGLTDPGVRVADVVTKAVALAAEEDDGKVFSDSPPQNAAVRPAMRPGQGEDDATNDGSDDRGAASASDSDGEAPTIGETTSDDAF